MKTDISGFVKYAQEKLKELDDAFEAQHLIISAMLNVIQKNDSAIADAVISSLGELRYDRNLSELSDKFLGRYVELLVSHEKPETGHGEVEIPN